LKKELANAVNSKEQLETNFSKVKKEKDGLEKQFTELKATTSLLKSELEKMQNSRSNQELNKQVILDHQQKLRSSEDRIDSLVKTMSAIRAEAQAKASKCSELNDALADKRHKVQELEKRLSLVFEEKERLQEIVFDLEHRLDANIQNSRRSSSSSGHQVLKVNGGDNRVYQTNTAIVSAYEEEELLKRLRKCVHQKRALIYQKKYLLNVLGGFQLTEKATLAAIANMNVTLDDDANSTSPTPKSRFKSAVLVTMALSRMKMLVKRWNGPGLRATAAPPANMMSPSRQANVHRSKTMYASPSSANRQLNGLNYSPSASSVASSSSHMSFDRKSSETNASLTEYVTRLNRLHKTLGIRAAVAPNGDLSSPTSSTINLYDDSI
jgi:hypothetical protein